MSLDGAWSALSRLGRVVVLVLIGVGIFVAGVIAAWLSPVWLP